VSINGVGKVGGALADHLHDEGARLTVADVRSAAAAAVAARTGAEVSSPDVSHAVACDLYSPCALGGALSSATIPELHAAAVVGCANNQLETPQDAQRIADSGVLYAPDYVVNAGGVINIAAEKGGHDRSRAEERIRGIHDTVLRVFDLADAEGITTAAAADLLAERRIDAARMSGDPSASAGTT
jgi:glutamate dehydrogenase/leucine dehydrogenase